MRMDPEQVEVRLDREVHVANQLGAGRLGERHPGRAVIRAHREHALAVHAQLPVLDVDLAECRPQPAIVARHSVDLDNDLHVALGLRTQPPGPPARRMVDLDREAEGVVPGREHHFS